VRRLTILLAALAALMLVPAAQALANGTATVVVEGEGSGEVSSAGGFFVPEGEGEFLEFWEGATAVECSYESPGPETGTCVGEMNEEPEVEPGLEAISLHAVPTYGSEFVEWVVLEGFTLNGCSSTYVYNCTVGVETGEGNVEVYAIFKPSDEYPLTISKGGSGSGTVSSEPSGIDCGSECSSSFFWTSYFSPPWTTLTLTAEPAPGSEFEKWELLEGSSFNTCKNSSNPCKIAMAEPMAIEAIFVCETEGGCEEEEEEGGPTNKRTLTVTKSPDPSSGAGAGSVKSKPKGINCATYCEGTQASLYKNTEVLISAKPAKGSTFTEWVGCEGEVEGKCLVTMSEDQEVEAVFGGESKAIPNPQELSLAKAGDGYGKVKSKPGGIVCEADCLNATALFFGGETEPKVKAAKTVVLTATAYPGSEFDGWEGCEAEPEGNCEVLMESAQSVTAEFSALPTNTLTVTKSPSPSAGAGAGSVKSKPKGINCATYCAESQATLAEDAVVVLKAKAAKGSTLAGWSGCESETNTGSEGTCTVAMSIAQEVTAEFGAESKAISNPQALTLTMAGSGDGKVKSKPAGIVCEEACDSATALFFGGETEPKVKAAKIVVLTGTPYAGSGAVQWSGCEAEPEPEPGLVQCEVSMATAQSVTATFDELE
jgi:Divergent InlB B-repeat domain